MSEATTQSAEPDDEDASHTDPSGLRHLWAQTLEDVRAFGTDLPADPPQGRATWIQVALPQLHVTGFDASWAKLASFHEAMRYRSDIDTNASQLAEGFGYSDVTRKWVFSDALLRAVGRRLRGREVVRAGRMLVFHEALHLETHRLTGATARAIRRLPKLLEHVDYQADVWAVIHEFAYSRWAERQDVMDDRALLLVIVRTAIDTMWAFDDGPDQPRPMEVRRVNRYLIWYWQLLRLEKTTTLPEALLVLARKPVIELAGPRLHAAEDRIFCDFDNPARDELELAALLENDAITRHGHGGATSVLELIEGLRDHKGVKIQDVLRSITDQHTEKPSATLPFGAPDPRPIDRLVLVEPEPARPGVWARWWLRRQVRDVPRVPSEGSTGQYGMLTSTPVASKLRILSAFHSEEMAVCTAVCRIVLMRETSSDFASAKDDEILDAAEEFARRRPSSISRAVVHALREVQRRRAAVEHAIQRQEDSADTYLLDAQQGSPATVVIDWFDAYYLGRGDLERKWVRWTVVVGCVWFVGAASVESCEGAGRRTYRAHLLGVCNNTDDQGPTCAQIRDDDVRDRAAHPPPTPQR